MLLTSLSCSALCLAPPEYLRRKLCCGLAECSRSLREPSYCIVTVMCWGKVESEWKEVTLWYLEMVRIPLSVTVIMSGFSMNGC